MADKENDIYFYIDPKIFAIQNCGGKEFLKEHINTHIATIKCLKEIVNTCVDKYEIENLKSCLKKLRSGIAELNISSLNGIINDLISGAEYNESKEKLSSKLKDFLLICELVILDLSSLKKNEEIDE